MRCSCPSTTPLLLLLPLLLLPLLATAATHCPVLGPGADPQTKAYLAPLVFDGTLTALARRGPALRATFRVDRAHKGQEEEPRPTTAIVEFAYRENPARCRGAPAALVELIPGRQFVVFAAWRRGRMLAVAEPEDIGKSKAVARVLCDQCAKAPSVRGMKDKTLEVFSKLRLKCKISGNPPPRVTWYKNGHRVKANSRLKIKTKRRHSHLVINEASADDSGNYLCRATNVLGNDTGTAKVVVTSTESTTDSTTWHYKKVPCPKEDYCLNGASCRVLKIIEEYVCECADGYWGQRCESKAISSLSIGYNRK